ncbi:MAG: hypothetical protein WC058_03305 [Phycisphaeraceae bacterium]
MPNFSNDGDLLMLEPGLFVDLPLVGQTKLKVTDGELTGNVLSSVTGGFNGLTPGDVVVIRSSESDGAAWAANTITDDHTLSLAFEPTGLNATTVLTVIARTLAPQAAEIHDQLLRAVGIAPGAEDANSELTEASVLSIGLMKRLEALGTLELAYRGAGLEAKAGEYRRRFAEAMRGARVLIDTDGDGLADVWRMPGVGRLVRG